MSNPRDERFVVERVVEDVLSPWKEFVHNQTVSSIVLVVATVAGLVMANSNLAEHYEAFGHIPIQIGVANWQLEMSIHHWVNDGLMVVFFFVLGLEIKRELLAGELDNRRTAIVVIAAALGGMCLPAAIYFALNAGTPAQGGWAIPMATDAAFALGALALLAGRIPTGLSAFLIGLAIIDDIGAVTVVAIFYTNAISFGALIWAAGLLFILFAFNVVGVRRLWPYLGVGIGLWFAVLSSGVHATIAGVLLALAIPARARVTAEQFLNNTRGLLVEYEQDLQNSDLSLGDSARHDVAQRLREHTREVTAPLERWEHRFQLPVAYVVIPLFAFLNAGIKLDDVPVSTWFSDPLSLGVIAGLVVGKVTGVFAFAWVACLLRIGELPSGVSFSHLAGAGLLAGMGFTMSLFIATLAFDAGSTALNQAKAGIFVASLISGALGIAWLWLSSNNSDDATKDN